MCLPFFSFEPCLTRFRSQFTLVATLCSFIGPGGVCSSSRIANGCPHCCRLQLKLGPCCLQLGRFGKLSYHAILCGVMMPMPLRSPSSSPAKPSGVAAPLYVGVPCPFDRQKQTRSVDSGVFAPDTPPERRLLKIVWLFEIVVRCKENISGVCHFPLLGNGRAQGQELMKALVQLQYVSCFLYVYMAYDMLTRASEAPRVLGPGGTNILSG